MMNSSRFNYLGVARLVIPDFILNDNHIELPKESVEASTDRPDVYIALPGTEQYRQQFLELN